MIPIPKATISRPTNKSYKLDELTQVKRLRLDQGTRWNVSIEYVAPVWADFDN